MTKIDIISGFLGAGKTTFIKKLLQEAIKGEQVVLIENEFGQIGIDGGFLKDSGIEIREMNSGCICCSLVGDFGKSLEEVLTKYKPERVIIEPSGVGKLSDVMNAVRDVAKNLDVKLNSAVTIVDATKCKMYMKNFGEFFNNQIENAGTIVMSRTDVADSKKVLADVELLREHNKDASIVTTPIDQLTGAQLLELIEKPDTMMEELLAQVKEEHAHHHHHEHGGHCGCGCEDHDHEHEHHHHDHDEECTCGCHDHDHEHGHQRQHSLLHNFEYRWRANPESSNTRQTNGSCCQFSTANHLLPLRHNLHRRNSGWCKRLFRQRSPLTAREADSTPAPRQRHHRRRRYVSSYRLTPGPSFQSQNRHQYWCILYPPDR